MDTIVSTKILNQEQKKLLSNFNLIEYNAIAIEKVKFKQPTQPLRNAIITSQNAAKIVIDNNIAVENVFCVGVKTKQLLLDSNYSVMTTSNSALELANNIVANFTDEEFTFFCADKRRAELPSILTQNDILFQEIIVYKTVLQSNKIESIIEGVLFYSPSGVESFMLENDLKNATAFCIGNTTAGAVKKYTDSIVVAKETTIESVLESIVGYF